MRRRKFKGMLKYFDIIGDIAIIDIKEEYKSLNRRIVEEILSTNKHVKVVLEKASPISGRYRIFKGGERGEAGKQNEKAIFEKIGNFEF